VRQTGSMGKDSYEPIVQVTIVDEPTVLYGRVNADVARRIMSQHVLGGKIVAENVIPS
jgi:NADP-reducing hydrogenase subunit HndB